MNKNYIVNEEALEKMQIGLEEVLKNIKSSYGPKGKHVVIAEEEGNNVRIVRDGIEIIKNLRIEDEFQGVSIKIVKEILENLNTKTSDGIKTALILANGMVKEAIKSIVTGVNPNLLIRGMEKIVEMCVEDLKEISEPFQYPEEIENILKISLQDDVIAKVISSLDLNNEIIINKVSNPIIYIEKSDRDKTYIALGDINDIEYEIRKSKFEKGMKLVKLNKEYGYNLGGESAYVKMINKMLNNLHLLEMDERVGGRIVVKALDLPLKQLAYTSNLEGEVIAQMVKISEENMGYDISINKLLDLKSVGIIEFTKVLQESLISAVSIASKVILTSGIIIASKVDISIEKMI